MISFFQYLTEDAIKDIEKIYDLIIDSLRDGQWPTSYTTPGGTTVEIDYVDGKKIGGNRGVYDDVNSYNKNGKLLNNPVIRINRNLPYNKMIETLAHEMKHANDFEKMYTNTAGKNFTRLNRTRNFIATVFPYYTQHWEIQGRMANAYVMNQSYSFNELTKLLNKRARQTSNPFSYFYNKLMGTLMTPEKIQGHMDNYVKHLAQHALNFDRYLQQGSISRLRSMLATPINVGQKAATVSTPVNSSSLLDPTDVDSMPVDQVFSGPEAQKLDKAQRRLVRTFNPDRGARKVAAAAAAGARLDPKDIRDLAGQYQFSWKNWAKWRVAEPLGKIGLSALQTLDPIGAGLSKIPSFSGFTPAIAFAAIDLTARAANAPANVQDLIRDPQGRPLRSQNPYNMSFPYTSGPNIDPQTGTEIQWSPNDPYPPDPSHIAGTMAARRFLADPNNPLTRKSLEKTETETETADTVFSPYFPNYPDPTGKTFDQLEKEQEQEKSEIKPEPEPEIQPEPKPEPKPKPNKPVPERLFNDEKKNTVLTKIKPKPFTV